ncbi:DUF952 domain-containing protein [uncultured Cohaesibacter sp.]|uniref:DUF952 domain-containing protein n=1 Tax=uncultured Cohaesibacter sp. TaxID=1002546 RepID=UPI00292E52BE|nr:DUF952 domain-containing protein [uncultured Cohaesibacter sp.]
MEKLIYKLATIEQWDDAKSTGRFKGAPIDIEDGFIHFSSAGQVEETARKHFRNVPSLLLLTVSVETLQEHGKKLVWEPSRGGALFPHLYDDLPLDAILEQDELAMDDNGFHVFPPLK